MVERLEISNEDGDEVKPKQDILKKIIPIAVPAILSIVFTLWYVGSIASGMVSKGDVDATLKGVTDAKVSLDASISEIPNTVTTQINSVMATVNNQLSSMQNTVNEAKAQSTAYSAKIDAANNAVVSLTPKVDSSVASISSLSTTINTLKADIASLKTQLDAANVKIVALEQGSTDTTSGTSPQMSVEVKEMTTMMIPSDDRHLNAQYKVILTNKTSSDLKDLILHIYMETGVTYAGVESFILTGGGTTWQGYGWNASSFEFINNSWGLNLSANDTKTLYLTATITGNTSANFLTLYPSGVGYNVDCEVE